MPRWIRTIVLGALVLAGLGVLEPLGSTQQLLPPPKPPAPPREYTLLFLGDIMLSRGVGVKMRAEEDWAYPFREIAGTLRPADLVYANLECPISDAGRDLHHRYSFRADPRALVGLKAAGIGVVSQANNHAYDWGPAALLDSLARLHAAGIRTVGAGENDLAAHFPTLVKVGDLRLAFLAYVNIDPPEATAGAASPGVAWLDPGRVLADIRLARPLADLVIVCPHWGIEYARRPATSQVMLAHKMIEAGADLVVGSHPHVGEPLEAYHGGWIAYSLGNCIFDQKDPATHRGLMLRVTVRARRVFAATLVPTAINANLQATLAPPPVPKTPRRVLTAQKLRSTPAR
jgi:poly-gamma-glutamate capsule biosynthesis protein CapA/YwtB (metallophosphatase superfamily)